MTLPLKLLRGVLQLGGGQGPLGGGQGPRLVITSNLADTARWVENLGKQAKFAAAVALTQTAKDIQKQIPAELDRSLDRPTEFTKKGTFVVPARTNSLVATVGFKDKQARYMAMQIAGGVYNPSAAGIKLPGNIQLNTFGNIPRGMVARLRAAAEDGSLTGALSKKLNVGGRRGKGSRPVRLFFGQPRGSGWENAPLGIYRHVPSSSPGGRGTLVPVIVFEKKPAVFNPKFDFAGLAQRTVQARFNEHFSAALSSAMRSAR